MAEREVLARLRGRTKSPNPSPKHEAKETPAEEKWEHKTGVEVQDEAGRKMYKK